MKNRLIPPRYQPTWNVWNVTSAGWQVALCYPIWHMSSSSGVATSVSELLYPCYFTSLLLYQMTVTYFRCTLRRDVFLVVCLCAKVVGATSSVVDSRSVGSGG